MKTSRSSNNKLAEMWNYEIDKNKGIVIIEPLIDGIVIDEVIINGNHHEAIPNNFYEYNQDSTSDLDVIVKFTLHERQQMTTHYDAEFNASIPSSGIDVTYTDDDSVVDVYSTAGVLLKKGCDKAQLRLLAPGIYILRSDNEVSKVIVK